MEWEKLTTINRRTSSIAGFCPLFWFGDFEVIRSFGKLPGTAGSFPLLGLLPVQWNLNHPENFYHPVFWRMLNYFV